jgi:hypothetical protein
MKSDIGVFNILNGTIQSMRRKCVAFSGTDKITNMLLMQHCEQTCNEPDD